MGIDSSEVAIDGGHPEGNGAHELVGGYDILPGLVLGGLYPQFAGAGVVVGSQALDIDISAIDTDLYRSGISG